MKTCSKCDVEKSLDDFHADKNKRDGHSYVCKQCATAHAVAWQRANRDKRSITNKAYYYRDLQKQADRKLLYRKNRPEYFRQARRRYTLKGYGLTEATFSIKLLEQQGKCEICRKDLTARKINIDHDHRTGKTRGLLCSHCNFMLGVIENDETMARIRSYQQKYAPGKLAEAPDKEPV